MKFLATVYRTRGQPGAAHTDLESNVPPPHERTGPFAQLGADVHAAVQEFVGTTLFLTLAFGGVQASAAEAGSAGTAVSTGINRIMYIALCFGFSLLVSAWLFFRVTGGLFNPNVSLVLFLTGVVGPVRFVLYCIAQLAGGIAAAGLVLAFTPGPLAANPVLADGINIAQGVFIEAFITATLCLAVLMLAAEKHIATPFAPVGIGLTLFTCELFSVYYTGGVCNTARAFGPAVVTGFPDKQQWVYWVGPGLGSLFAAAFYTVLKHFRYWRLNPGQDEILAEQSPADPVALLSAGAGTSRASRRMSCGAPTLCAHAPSEKRPSVASAVSAAPGTGWPAGREVGEEPERGVRSGTVAGLYCRGA